MEDRSPATLRRHWEEGQWSLLLRCVQECAYRRIRNSADMTMDDADDVVSKVVTKLLYLTPPDNPQGFIETCVSNQIRDLLKERKRHALAEVHVLNSMGDGQNRLNVLDRMIIREDIRTVAEHTDERQRELLLYITRRITGEDAASLHKTNVGTIKMRAVRLRERLRALLT